MIKLGRINTLKVTRHVDFGVYLDGGESGEILMPAKYIDKPLGVGEETDVFVYRDGSQRLVATKEKPLAMAGEFAYLECAAVNRFGAFMDWGVVKQLLVPFSEMKLQMKQGRRYMVYVYVDDASDRIVASAKIDKFLGNVYPEYRVGDTVKAQIIKRNEMGFSCIVDNLHKGMIYLNESYADYKPGEIIDAKVRQVRRDGKIDLTPGGKSLDRTLDVASRIEYIVEEEGSLALCDSSSPEEIKLKLHCSKKDFKKALGHLLKNKKVSVKDGVILK